ncbi:DUF2207 domain-containing protein [Glaciihabitans arcticus]|uniref:DUF2207 domain-containing protein n=1 Tax=Glaciihabitans arcticus TaxID=2668039 RepID=A0A4V6MTM8_9MICO|nr:DUF2207 domain-containing protein [Glaciihabitans arcticus]TBN56649.1 DUF2207 domain-containing protein [Glaciihabitans arcticus]
MKKSLAIVALALAGVFAAAAPASADVQDFEFASFDATYTLSLDEDGRSQLTTVETIVAVFPDFDQNHGIARALVDNYDGHPVDIEIDSVTDGDGEPLDYETDSEDEFTIVTVADEDFVYGEQTYVLTYTQHNVTRFFADTGADEFYWDTNGTGSAQPFGSVTATVVLEDGLADRVTEFAAYSGAENSDTPADGTYNGDGSYTFTATDLGPGENLSFAIGFEPDTFIPRDSSFLGAPWPFLSLLGGLGSLIVAGVAAVLRRTRLADAPGRGTIIAEYMPPKGASLPLSALISGTVSKSTPAHIVKLAVAGNLRILELPGKKASYQLEFLGTDGADADDLEFLHALFGKELTPGEDRSLEKVDDRAAKRITALRTRVAKDSVASGHRRTLPAGLLGWLFAASFVTAAAGVIFALVSLATAFGGAVPIAFLGVAVAGLIATIALAARSPLDPAGVELRDYLKGLKLYITLAEADRLRYLQSPEGAEKTPIAADDTAQLVKLNERLLPYAILFGEEKEWTKQLGRYYEDLGEEPGWYSGTTAFNAGVFVGSISALSTSAATAYTGSSSSGGSSGGGFSGGGGGGGGIGGV